MHWSPLHHQNLQKYHVLEVISLDLLIYKRIEGKNLTKLVAPESAFKTPPLLLPSSTIAKVDLKHIFKKKSKW